MSEAAFDRSIKVMVEKDIACASEDRLFDPKRFCRKEKEIA